MGRDGGMTEFPDRLFQFSELQSLGISRRQLRNALARALIRQVLRDVYCPGSLPDDVTLRAQAALLVLPKNVVVSDHSAAWLHGIDCFDPTALDVPPDLEVVSYEGTDRIRRTGIFGGKRALIPEDICAVDGVAVTTPLRTACDLACLRGRFAALAVLDAFMRAFDLTLADFERMVKRYAGRRGVVQLRELIRYANPLAESPGESWTRMAIIDWGLPVPKPQVWVTVEGERFRLDLAYRHLKIAVEYDGEPFHTSDEQRDADRKRRGALRRAGWVVIVVDKDDFTSDARTEWLTELSACISERRPTPRRVYARAPQDRSRSR